MKFLSIAFPTAYAYYTDGTIPYTKKLPWYAFRPSGLIIDENVCNSNDIIIPKSVDRIFFSKSTNKNFNNIKWTDNVKSIYLFDQKVDLMNPSLPPNIEMFGIIT